MVLPQLLAQSSSTVADEPHGESTQPPPDPVGLICFAIFLFMAFGGLCSLFKKPKEYDVALGGRIKERS